MITYFIEKLSEDELVDLINFCILSRNLTTGSNNPLVETAKRVGEIDRSFESQTGMIIQTSGDNKILDAYRIGDFEMKSYNYGINDGTPTIDYSYWLKSRLYAKFGEEYIQELVAYRQSMLGQEIKSICESLEPVRN